VTAKFKADTNRKWLTLDYRPLELEKEVRKFWQRNKVLEKMSQLRHEANKGVLGYVEGPPTLNGVPHVGHARGRVMKDLRYRWKTMQGYYMPFWTGWDCQGLPVELEVERQLGVKNKKELLEKYGEEKVVEECKKTVQKYYQEWHKADGLLGVFINDSKAYWTYLDEYIEREWQYLKRAWEQDLLGEGYYVVAYCPHCQTSLSQAEVGLGYEEVEDPSLYFKMKLSRKRDTYFLVWTTMPFTLVTDLMLAVHPEAEYAKVKVKREMWLLARNRVEAVMQELGINEYKVTETVSGKELEGTKYEYPFLDMVQKQEELDKMPNVHTVVCEEFVDIITATGVVHLAPGNGEDDFLAAQRRNVPVYVPFDEECKFTEDAGEFAGLFARDADKKVVEEMQKRSLLVSVKTVKHEYPTCWRSHHKLIWLARKEYFLWTNKINDKVVEAAGKVEYFYDAPKNRFLAFLKEGKPWCVSRERVWGAPLPVWICQKCKHKTLVSSKKELLEKAVKKPQGHFELHKPWVDRLTLKCSECGAEMKREPFVLDTWHNSGASPYARFTDKEFKTYVPVDFLTEGIDQTRGWANTLLLEHVILTGRPEAPYRAFLFQGLAQDAKGRKMSKSLGNVVEANPTLEKYSADVFRFYVLWKCSPIDTISFDTRELVKRPYQVLSTLYHLHRFFMQNAEYDKFNSREHTFEWAKIRNVLKPPDYWLLSKLQRTVRAVTEKLEKCEFQFALSELEEFVVEDLSRQYVPMVRRELWSDDPETRNRRLAVYTTLWHMLKTLTLLFNPATPYLSEFLYQKVCKELDRNLTESVNFESWPKPDKKLENENLEKQFETLLQCVSLVYSARQAARLKRRWPLRKIMVVAPKHVQEALKTLEEEFLELTNVKNAEYFEKHPEVDSKRWVSASNGEEKVFLDTSRDERLLGEGVMRDLARRVQALRKELGFMPTDILKAVHFAELDQKTVKLLEPYLAEMTGLVRSEELYFHFKQSEVEIKWHKSQLDDKTVYVAIE
jgi:isoleucyl-tRNA synthetase